MESYTDNPRREIEKNNNTLTRLYAISAYTLTPKGLILAVKTTTCQISSSQNFHWDLLYESWNPLLENWIYTFKKFGEMKSFQATPVKFMTTFTQIDACG